jgi:hypothetical protein
VPDKIDIVDVFRPSSDAPEIARQAVAVGAKAVWLQLNIRSEEARRIAEAAGLDYVEDSCTAVVGSLYRIKAPVRLMRLESITFASPPASDGDTGPTLSRTSHRKTTTTR